MLTQDQIADYHRDGFTVARGVFSPGEIDALRREADELSGRTDLSIASIP